MDIETCLRNKFSNFIDNEYLIMKKESDNYPIIDDDWDESKENKTIIMKHIKYKFIFPHDFNTEIYKNKESIDKIKNKYERRIKRFELLMLNEKIEKKIFIIIKDKEKEGINKLEKTMNELGYKKYKIKYITNEELPKSDNWKREKFDWKKFFTE